ncbi:hypothetical protein SAMN02799622_02377 [Methylobacterium sp. UNC378MF]|uniref:hypothetical protein n=1 Tax=Methylobacterium sp. UNC378MF TaxID=1502748 RepID=UPI000885329D|nr:hypothetical protein [Methylobacterium sp. UNC378MF]SDA19990.1 hypothetical protein SAMN02799622_02377 [Methylobacterium sp. UNC378MF]
MSTPARKPVRRAVDWMFRDRTTGAITVAQWPNLPLWLFAGFSLAGWLAQDRGELASWLTLGADIALAWWAADELLRGVNPWRRILGAVTLVGLATLITLRRAA